MHQRVAYLALPSTVLLTMALAAACLPETTEENDPSSGGSSGNAGSGGSAAGIGGAMNGGTSGVGTGGTTGGVGGVGGTGGVGGSVTAGMGGMPTGGVGGSVTAGMGGVVAGTGGTATGGMAGLPPGGSGGDTAGSSGAGGQTAGAGGSGAGTGGSAGGGTIDDFVEDPGAACTVPAMPTVASLTADPKLPDPFMNMSGTRMTDKSEWLCRREEILQQGYEFIYGDKPRTPKSATTGSVTNSMISVTVNDMGKTTTFSVTVSIPNSGSPPYPAVIGFGSIGFASELGSRGIASINYNAYTLGAENGGSGPKTGGFYTIYGSTHDAGLLVAWAWGVSRILDVLELHPEVIDPTKIGVTGCSRFGKGAFVVGVLDHRIALTVPVESGVGGTPALRLIGNLDSGGEWPYHAISYERWFSQEKLSDFATANNANGDTTDKLPVDMHEMIGLIAPRGLYIVDNPSTNYAGLDRNSAWVTANAGAKIFEALGVGDNITYQGASGSHCQWRSAYTAPLVANLQKFLLGDANANTGTFATDFNGPDPETHYDWTVPTLAGTL